MVLKQKRAFNPLVQGFGLMFIFIYGILNYYHNFSIITVLLFLPLVYVGLWINFSSIKLYVNENGVLIRETGFFPIRFKFVVYINEFDCILIKAEKVSFSTKFAGPPIVILGSNPVYDNYTGLFFKLNKKYDFDLIIKANKKDILKFIETQLHIYNLPVFDGVIKKERQVL